LFKRLSFRQTLIPVLLTLGVLMPIFGVLPLVMPAESPWAAISDWVAYLCIGLGVALLGLAIVNMLLVRQQLADLAKA